MEDSISRIFKAKITVLEP
jgi:hypothetical protein